MAGTEMHIGMGIQKVVISLENSGHPLIKDVLGLQTVSFENWLME